ncbi:hypothetical protein NEMBOFW57_003883 [Staphylotrichum longicolle]|uniref:Uncharacterized protein n=1 Tax=Staphylotrichum longicolle TaxID=669026 RepID=A0AAD4F729_9PEZI|nr:hypothetical protein NEMBOFW57_003883 [Staphylotrichum longicolle]
MPMKRLSPASDSSDVAELPLKKTQRTHEENQERAYIAASRRADRDIEHRIRSALKASECRRKRTGRGLKITREAVMGDEQYESEDDDPATRRYSLPATATHLSHPYPSNQADRYAEIDALFAQHFPNVHLSSSQWRPQPHPHQQQAPYHPRALSLQTAYIPRYPHPEAAAPAPPAAAAAAGAAVGATHPSPLITPPASYPLPPARLDEDPSAAKSRSMSPLALEGSSSSSLPKPPTSQPAATVTAAALNLGDISLADPGYILDAHDHGGAWYHHPHHHHHQQEQPPQQQMGPDGPSGRGGAGPGAGPGGWHARTLSLPLSLEGGFQFPAPSASASSSSDMVGAGLVDPVMLPVGGIGGGSSSVAGLGADVSVTPPPGEPWADWVNLDAGEVPAMLGVKV